MIAEERIRALNNRPVADRPYVIYWMQSAQRTECNHALEYAIRQANSLRKPLLVYFGITEDFPDANERHYRFMLEGLREVKASLAEKNIGMLVMKASPEDGALKLSPHAAMLVTDRGYLRAERAWSARLAAEAPCLAVQVETNVIVPLETASPKEEYTAATLRPKLNRLLNAFALPLNEHGAALGSLGLRLPVDAFDIEDTDLALSRLHIDRSVKAAEGFTGGTSRAKLLLDDFIGNKLSGYAQFGSDPGLDYTSNLSPYLHFGQISPLYIYLRLKDIAGEAAGAFLEELTVRRELAMNYVFYNARYDAYDAIPAWAKATLDKHRGDLRPYAYPLGDLEEGHTHDPYWNAAQREMAVTGKMNGYMRMYWGKKILEWTAAPEEAFSAAVYLNNKYNLDGRDPNGFAGVAWCFGKHDRPWQERGIFGCVRYMNFKGLDRKFDMARYLNKVARLGSVDPAAKDLRG